VTQERRNLGFRNQDTQLDINPKDTPLHQDMVRRDARVAAVWWDQRTPLLDWNRSEGSGSYIPNSIELIA
jgi:hypothetical protein